ncbi:MAG: Type pilin PilA [Bacteriovoracaceae bacterium]|nr:Type pilin PilA [Bacteriovoracaceae bacterium]
MKTKKESNIFGFTMIELMITVAIIGILAAVAIPQYIYSVRRSYLNEVNSAFAAIKSAEESYYTNNKCYIDAAANPASVPTGGKPSSWDTGSAATAWQTSVLNVRPDANVRFQYQIYASNSYASAVATTTACGTTLNQKTYIGASGALDCVGNVVNLIPDTVFDPTQSSWYVIVARGKLSGAAQGSNIISVIDNSAIIMCNELN